MPQEKLSLTTLPLALNGAIERKYDQTIKRLLADMEDRPDLEKPREITLTVKLVPRAEFNENTRQYDLDGIAISFSVKHKIPDAVAPMNSIAKAKGGEIIFATESRDDPDQLDMEDMRRTKVEQAKAGIVPPAGPRMASGL